MKILLAKIMDFLPYFMSKPIRWVWRHLPPRDKRLILGKLNTLESRSNFINSSAYQDFLKIEANYWASEHLGQAATSSACSSNDSAGSRQSYRHYMEHPYIKQQIYARAGLKYPDIWQWIKSNNNIYRKALVPGAGNGAHCYVLMEMNIAKHVVATDIDEDSALAFNATKGELNVDYKVCDLNLDLPNSYYDACFAFHSLHHLVDLEGFFARLRNRMSKHDGVLFIEEYVGPDFLTPTKRQTREIDRIWKTLPDKLKRDESGRVRKKLHLPDRWEVQRRTPFESIRSTQILAALSDHFLVEERYELGGALSSPLFSAIINNLDSEECYAHVIDQILEREKQLALNRVLPNCYVLLRARPAPQGDGGDGDV